MASFKAGKYEVYITRVKINREGYTTGKYPQYYGSGADIFRYDTYPYESSLEGEIRAYNMKDAKARIMGMSKFQNEMKQTNPGQKLRSGEWTPAHAVRIRKGKLEILR